MIKFILESAIGRKVDKQIFSEALNITTADIKANNVYFNKTTKLNEVIEVLIKSVLIIEKIKKDSLQTA